ncbi:uncharacterized protein Z520_07312 [Fonsecaea multimorphosa CBS 102226]|uniref:LIM interaction domain-containing protein n=1 Tax=Fonsecaea multimorphosa CBS 102226 TaxID=1442371 RepID=A0A0D2KKP1_9EURO|nr:uncharacterized protein Z520_07312 [Fonsecaea multimorphosa CBS 102226]KIX97198.1 hypothetical protein Z520_07312 [Fonsecaea multimorphosa CBS 102226]
MMAQSFPHHAGIAPGHPGIPPGHPMGMQHPGAGHMGGQPGPGMMQAMHPGVSAPQVTQGPMVTGMPPGAGTPAPGPMHNGMAMAHMNPQQALFQQHNPQMNYGQGMMTPQQQQFMARQRMMQQMSQAQAQGMPMGIPNAPGFNQAQLAQMKMGMAGMHPQMGMNPNHPQMQQLQQHQHNQQQLMRAQQAQAQAQQHAAQMAAAAQNQRAVAQQMQMSRSQEQTTQPPQSQPTPAPQTQPPQQPPPTSQPQAQPAQPKPQPPQPQPVNNQPQNQPVNQPVKTTEPEEEPRLKQQQEVAANMIMSELPKQDMIGGQCILKLIEYQDLLAHPERPNDLDYWEALITRFFSPIGSLRQQFFNNKSGGDKSFQLQFPSLARYYHSYFASGVKQILLQSFEHTQTKTANGGVHITSSSASLTYVFGNDIRVTTNGQLRVLFDDVQTIEHLNISSTGWQEYIPRNVLLQPMSPEMKQSPKITNKNLKRTQGKANVSGAGPVIPSSGVGEWGVPQHISQFLEIAEVMTAMGPLMEYYQQHPGISPKDTLLRVTQENAQNMAQANNQRLNQMARAANGQVIFPNQMNPGMNGPNMMNSPAMGHLNVPQAQGSPMMGGPVHTPSPAQNPTAGGVAMMHQMSAQGSNLSGSQGPSTNTSPNVSNKRRRASVVKIEEENAQGEVNGANKVKPSPKLGGKRQKGSA